MEQNSKRWWVLICVGVITFMSDLDASIVNVALPVINRSLHITMSLSELLISVYLVVICVCLLPFGKLGDSVGKIKIFKIGMVVFTLGSLLCGISPAFGMLLAARAIQAVGAAMTMSTNNGIITETFSTKERGQALGWIGSFVALGMIAGPGVGGVILNSFPWEAIFWINVPIGVAMVILGLIVLPRNKTVQHTQFDGLGTILVSVGIIGVFTYLYGGQQFGYANAALLVCLVVALLAIVGFVGYERHTNTPLIDLSIFKSFYFSVGVGTAILIFVANNFYMVLTPFYLETARNLGPNIAGYMMMALPLVQVIIAEISGRLSDRFGSLKISVVGLGIILVTQVLFAHVTLQTTLVSYCSFIGLLGLGNAIFQSPNNAMIMGAVPSNQLGIAGSVNALARNLGMVLGNALATSLLFVFMSHLTNTHITNFTGTHAAAYITGQQWIYWLGSALVLVAVVISLARNLTKRQSA